MPGWKGSLVTSVFSNLVSVHCQTVEPKTMPGEKKLDKIIKQMRQFKVKRSVCSGDRKGQGDSVSQSSFQLSVCQLGASSQMVQDCTVHWINARPSQS